MIIATLLFILALFILGSIWLWFDERRLRKRWAAEDASKVESKWMEP